MKNASNLGWYKSPQASGSHQKRHADVLKQVKVDDLLSLNRKQVWINTTLSWPWLVLGWVLAWYQLYPLAMLATAVFYMLALRQAHDAYHHTIGLSRTATHVLLHLLSMSMLCATHAIRHTHLQHHKHVLNEADIEGSWSRRSGWQAIVFGPVFYCRIQANGLKHGDAPTQRHAQLNVLLIAIVLLATTITQAHVLVYHVLSMLVCSWLVGFFAVWSVHHGCDGEHEIARTERNKWINAATAHLLFHVEHHLFPAVPCNHLPELSKRLDHVAPYLTHKRVWQSSRLST